MEGTPSEDQNQQPHQEANGVTDESADLVKVGLESQEGLKDTQNGSVPEASARNEEGEGTTKDNETENDENRETTGDGAAETHKDQAEKDEESDLQGELPERTEAKDPPLVVDSENTLIPEDNIQAENIKEESKEQIQETVIAGEERELEEANVKASDGDTNESNPTPEIETGNYHQSADDSMKADQVEEKEEQGGAESDEVVGATKEHESLKELDEQPEVEQRPDGDKTSDDGNIVQPLIEDTVDPDHNAKETELERGDTQDNIEPTKETSVLTMEINTNIPEDKIEQVAISDVPVTCTQRDSEERQINQEAQNTEGGILPISKDEDVTEEREGNVSAPTSDLTKDEPELNTSGVTVDETHQKRSHQDSDTKQGEEGGGNLEEDEEENTDEVFAQDHQELSTDDIAETSGADSHDSRVNSVPSLPDDTHLSDHQTQLEIDEQIREMEVKQQQQHELEEFPSESTDPTVSEATLQVEEGPHVVEEQKISVEKGPDTFLEPQKEQREEVPEGSKDENLDNQSSEVEVAEDNQDKEEEIKLLRSTETADDAGGSSLPPDVGEVSRVMPEPSAGKDGGHLPQETTTVADIQPEVPVTEQLEDTGKNEQEEASKDISEVRDEETAESSPTIASEQYATVSPDVVADIDNQSKVKSVEVKDTVNQESSIAAEVTEDPSQTAVPEKAAEETQLPKESSKEIKESIPTKQEEHDEDESEDLLNQSPLDTPSAETPLVVPTQKKPIHTEKQRHQSKEDSPAVIPTTSTMFEEPETSGTDEKAPLVSKSQDEGKTGYGTRGAEETKGQQAPSGLFARIRTLVNSYCNIL